MWVTEKGAVSRVVGLDEERLFVVLRPTTKVLGVRKRSGDGAFVGG